jgi:hypothetical protein
MRRLACVKQQVQDGQEIHQPPPQTAELCDHRGVVSRQAGAVKLIGHAGRHRTRAK